MRTNICLPKSIIFLMVSLLLGACSHPVDDPWLDRNSSNFHGDSFLNCASCHELSTECIECHFDSFGSKSPSDWVHGTIPHSEMKDSEEVCNTCHAIDRSYDIGPNGCHDCHDQVEMHVMGDPWLYKNSPDFHGNSTSDCSVCHDLTTSCSECHFGVTARKSPSDWIHGTIPHSEMKDSEAVCNKCHAVDRSYDIGPNGCHDCHDVDPELHESSNRQCTICHQSNLRDTHSDCALCHSSSVLKVQDAIAAGNTNCSACHGGFSHHQHHESSNTDCTTCHQSNLQDTHSNCTLCHESSASKVQDAIAAGNTNCSACHGSVSHDTQHDMTMTDSSDCLECHVNNVFTEHVTNQTLQCSVCHESSRQDVRDAIAQGSGGEIVYCSACHGVSSHRQAHESSNTDCTTCHQSNLQDTHSNCTLCHESSVPEVENAIVAGNTNCSACHGSISHENQHDMTMTDSSDCLECHVNNVFTEHVTNQTLQCSVCHESSRQDVRDAIAQGSGGEIVYCSACHGVSSHRQAHESSNTDCTTCHQSNLQDTHGTCTLCHESSVPEVENAIAAGNTDCKECHSVEDIHGAHYPVVSCTDCHGDVMPNP